MPGRFPRIGAPDLSRVLAGSLAAADWLAAGIIVAASLTSFGLSFHGLYVWAAHHRYTGIPQGLFPLMVDSFIAVGELYLFTGILRGRSRLLGLMPAAAAVLGGLAISVAANADQFTHASAADHLGWALPPVAAAFSLALGLGSLKHAVGQPPAQPPAREDTPPPAAAVAAPPAAVPPQPAVRPRGRQPDPIPAAALAQLRSARDEGRTLSRRTAAELTGLTPWKAQQAVALVTSENGNGTRPPR